MARDVKRLADSLLHGDSPDDEVSITIENTKEKPQESESPNVELVADDVIPEENHEISEIDIKPGAEVNDVEPSHGQDLTIAMALMPQFVIDECLMPIFMPPKEKSTCLKQISEVPSELRMLSVGARETSKMSETLRRLSLVASQRNRKRRIKRRVNQTRVRHIVSCFNSRRPTRFHDVIDIDISQSEVLQRFDSFHSLREDATEPHHKIDAFTETNFEKADKETETEGIYIESKESSVQVNDDMNPERMLDCVPSQTRIFINLLKTSVLQDSLEMTEFNKNLLKRWEADKEFRDGLEILQTYSVFDTNNNEQVSAENYEHFVNAMSCLHVLEELFKPTKVPVRIAIAYSYIYRINT